MLLERSHEGVLVQRGLETTMTKLGAGIDELQLNVFQSTTLGVDQQRLKRNYRATTFAAKLSLSINKLNTLNLSDKCLDILYFGQLRRSRTLLQVCHIQSRHRLIT